MKKLTFFSLLYCLSTLSFGFTLEGDYICENNDYPFHEKHEGQLTLKKEDNKSSNHSEFAAYSLIFKNKNDVSKDQKFCYVGKAISQGDHIAIQYHDSSNVKDVGFGIIKIASKIFETDKCAEERVMLQEVLYQNKAHKSIATHYGFEHCTKTRKIFGIT